MITIALQQASRILNSGPTMILSTRMDARINLMAITWVNWMSTNPPLVGMTVHPSSFSHHLLRQTGDFVLNVIGSDLIDLTHQLGTTSGRTLDKMRTFDVATRWGREVKALTLSYALAALECEVVNYQKTGDQAFFTGEVRYAAVDEDSWDGRWKEGADLVHYLGGDRYLTGGKIVNPSVQITGRCGKSS